MHGINDASRAAKCGNHQRRLVPQNAFQISGQALVGRMHHQIGGPCRCNRVIRQCVHDLLHPAIQYLRRSRVSRWETPDNPRLGLSDNHVWPGNQEHRCSDRG